MGSWTSERVPIMPPISMAQLEIFGEAILSQLQPEALKAPRRLDLPSWVDGKLARVGIYVYPVRARELGDREAETNPLDDDEAEILLERDGFDKLYLPDARSNRPRATLLHELSHAILHVNILRERAKASPSSGIGLARRGTMKPYCDPEWQAWALAGSIGMPRQTIGMLNNPSASDISGAYGFSTDFASNHLRRLGLLPKEDE